jgi:hypothetical protein
MSVLHQLPDPPFVISLQISVFNRAKGSSACLAYLIFMSRLKSATNIRPHGSHVERTKLHVVESSKTRNVNDDAEQFFKRPLCLIDRRSFCAAPLRSRPRKESIVGKQQGGIAYCEPKTIVEGETRRFKCLILPASTLNNKTVCCSILTCRGNQRFHQGKRIAQ